MADVRKITNTLLDVLFPPACLFCQTSVPRGDNLCAPCRAKITIFNSLQCAKCGARLPENTKICHYDTPYRLAAATQYDEPITKSLIWQLKYKHRTTAAPILAQILLEHLALANFDASTYALIPIPLHSRRQRERGYNQSELIARELGKFLHLPVLTETIRRRRYTKPQAEIKDFKEREQNLTNCFTIQNASAVANQNILLIDDVSTSGTTLREAALVLKNAGANTIVGLVVARAR